MPEGEYLMPPLDSSGDNRANLPRPTAVRALQRDAFKQVSCGHSHVRVHTTRSLADSVRHVCIACVNVVHYMVSIHSDVQEHKNPDGVVSRDLLAIHMERI